MFYVIIVITNTVINHSFLLFIIITILSFITAEIFWIINFNCYWPTDLIACLMIDLTWTHFVIESLILINHFLLIIIHYLSINSLFLFEIDSLLSSIWITPITLNNYYEFVLFTSTFLNQIIILCCFASNYIDILLIIISEFLLAGH
jgi:hypothetical protein